MSDFNSSGGKKEGQQGPSEGKSPLDKLPFNRMAEQTPFLRGVAAYANYIAVGVAVVIVLLVVILAFRGGSKGGAADAAAGGAGGAEAGQAKTAAKGGGGEEPAAGAGGNSSSSQPGDFGYGQNEAGNGIVIWYYTGAGGIVTIPDTIENIPVTAFNGDVFQGKKYIVSVTIPETVTEIPESAFRGCENLASVTLPMTNLTSIGASAFSGTALRTVSITGSRTAIGNYAFYNCDSLKTFKAEGTLISIGSSAFDGDQNLESVTLPDTVTGIGNYAFRNCIELREFTVPAAVAFTRGSGAFQNCGKLLLATRTQLKAQGYAENLGLPK